jgi:transcriptional regulator with XRE-family HTH domain
MVLIVMDISRAIRLSMADQRIKNAEIVERTGWSTSYVSLVKAGKARPEPRLQEWASVLNVPASELVIRAEQYPDPETQHEPMGAMQPTSLV